MKLRSHGKENRDWKKEPLVLKDRQGVSEEWDRVATEIWCTDAYYPDGFPLGDFFCHFPPKTLNRLEVAYLHVMDAALTIHTKGYHGLCAE